MLNISQIQSARKTQKQAHSVQDTQETFSSSSVSLTRKLNFKYSGEDNKNRKFIGDILADENSDSCSLDSQPCIKSSNTPTKYTENNLFQIQHKDSFKSQKQQQIKGDSETHKQEQNTKDFDKKSNKSFYQVENTKECQIYEQNLKIQENQKNLEQQLNHNRVYQNQIYQETYLKNLNLQIANLDLKNQLLTNQQPQNQDEHSLSDIKINSSYSQHLSANSSFQSVNSFSYFQNSAPQQKESLYSSKGYYEFIRRRSEINNQISKKLPKATYLESQNVQDNQKIAGVSNNLQNSQSSLMNNAHSAKSINESAYFQLNQNQLTLTEFKADLSQNNYVNQIKNSLNQTFVSEKSMQVQINQSKINILNRQQQQQISFGVQPYQQMPSLNIFQPKEEQIQNLQKFIEDNINVIDQSIREKQILNIQKQNSQNSQIQIKNMSNQQKNELNLFQQQNNVQNAQNTFINFSNLQNFFNFQNQSQIDQQNQNIYSSYASNQNFNQHSVSNNAQEFYGKQIDDQEIQRSKYLNDLIEKINNNSHIDIKSLKDHIYECSIDQFGSRFIQQTLDQYQKEKLSNPDQVLFVNMVFDEILPHLNHLMQDLFGNYVLQKILDYGSQSQRAAIIDQLIGNVVPLIKSKYGCRVIQKAFDLAHSDQQNLIVLELKNCHITDLIKDQNANHFIQKMIEVLNKDVNSKSSQQHLQFITKKILQKLEMLCFHKYGCRIIQKLMMHNTDSKQHQKIINLIVNEKFDHFIIDQYGNYMIQTIIEFQIENCNQIDQQSIKQIQENYKDVHQKILKKVKGKICEYSCHKFASNVIEKCIVISGYEDILSILNEIYKNNNCGLFQMMKSKFGNYVIQKIIDRLIQLSQSVQNSEQMTNMKQKFIDLLIEIYKSNKQQIVQQKDSSNKPYHQNENYARHVYEYLLKIGIVQDKINIDNSNKIQKGKYEKQNYNNYNQQKNKQNQNRINQNYSFADSQIKQINRSSNQITNNMQSQQNSQLSQNQNEGVGKFHKFKTQ